MITSFTHEMKLPPHVFSDTHTVRSATPVATISDTPKAAIRTFSFSRGTLQSLRQTQDPCIVRTCTASLPAGLHNQ